MTQSRNGNLWVYRAETRSASRGTLVFVNEPAQPVASVHPAWWRISPTLDCWPTIGRRELQAAMRSMTVVMVNKHRQDSFKMPGAANQQPVHREFQNTEEISHNGTTGSNSQLVDYAASWKHCTTQSHMRRSRS